MKMSIPHSFTIIFVLIIIMAGLTWLLPAGEYDKKYNEETSRELVVAGTYKEIKAMPQGLVSIFTAFSKGLKDSAEVIAFVLIIGGSYGVIMRSGAIEGGLGYVVKKLGSKAKIVIITLMFLFSLGGTATGMWEETIPFVMIAIPLMIVLGFDPIVGVAIVIIGAGTGNLASIVNPFSVGIASSIVGVHIGEGFQLRLAFYVVSLIISITYVLWYALRIKKDPTKSIVYNKMPFYKEYFLKSGNIKAKEGKSSEVGDNNEVLQTVSDFSGKHKLILAAFFIMIIFMVYSIIALGWWTDEISMLFLAMAFFTAIVSKMNNNEFWESFIKGVANLIPAVLVIGLARGIVVVANEGAILDTILYNAATFLGSLSKPYFIILNEIVEISLGLLVPSSSAHAALSMPIMGPLADLFEIPRSMIVMAYQASSGLANFITPTSGVLMAAILVAKISYGAWLKFMLPLFLLHVISTFIFLVIGVLIS